MKSRPSNLFLSSTIAALLAVNAKADVFVENFDSYAVGSNLHQQNGWKGWDNAVGAGAFVSGDFSLSGMQSVSIVGSSDLVHEFDIAGGQWTLSVMQYIPSTATGTGYFLLQNIYNDGGPYNWSIQIQNDTAAGLIISDEGGGVTLPMVKDAWVEYRIEIDLDSNSADEYYNGEFLSSHVWQDGNGADEIGAIDLYANGGGPFYYDNLRIEDVNNPCSFAISSIEFDSVAGAATITWPSRSGSTYAVDYSDDLVEWTEIDDGIPAEGDTTSFTQENVPSSATQRYYRVRAF